MNNFTNVLPLEFVEALVSVELDLLGEAERLAVMLNIQNKAQGVTDPEIKKDILLEVLDALQERA